MCGIAGILGGAGSRDERTEGARRMGGAIAHRGPDDHGVWHDDTSPVALAHQRLSIIDLSPAGHQPMSSRSGRLVVAYNGEIYNFAELRAALDAEGARSWRGGSDTEVLIEAIERWGLDEALHRCVGMFAVAVWDRETRRLSLARDRLGIKPLYWGVAAGAFVFGSEPAAVAAAPGFDAAVDRNAVALLLRYNAIPAPHSIYRDAHKLPPGCAAEISLDAPHRPTVRTWWDAAAFVSAAAADPFAGSPSEAVDALDDVLGRAVRDRMVADVPIGAFLSGGIDSSTVTALMQRASGRPIRTFSIGFEDAGYDEGDDAARVAAHLGTDHTALVVTPAEVRDVIPRLPTMFSEPFSDSSQMPTFLVSQLARRDVTVALSGDGGDELFAGYNRHVWGPKVWRSLRRVPTVVRRPAAGALGRVSTAQWQRLVDISGAVVPWDRWVRVPVQRIEKLVSVLGAESPQALYRTLVSHWSDPAAVVIGATEPHLERPGPAPAGFAEAMMFGDLVTYLPDDILTKVDRASMAVGLEARVPILDHRVLELAWRMPLSLKLRDGVGKWVLRELLSRHVPRALFERPKMGFGIPVGGWLTGPLRPWAESLLDERALRDRGLLDPAPIRARWQEHVCGVRDHQYALWDVLMLLAWLEHHDGSRASAGPLR